ncbi:glycosyltransferase family protein [Mucilaginibacter ginsenosidivorans]|uniref:Glycosyltransferase family 4 protein n=1 Tax=Mucilaginibacter ginsenosidivorans TaxID=398053 RepID=A0A5B8UUG9_9SPHI|nr:glycosyltransferase family 4 protein [Mucilaginibacter ginsenosidivorans]QEC62572.1 glycosyltransferase family 4 protein [Mucilaginibacter ginsenosidivorans]
MDPVPVKKVCLVTPGHIASDPRLVKEATALSAAGYQVYLVFTQHVEELVAYDRRILQEHPEWHAVFLYWAGNSWRSKFRRVCSRFRQRLSRDPASTLNRHFSWQLRAAVACRADLYIGHNPGALPVVVLAAVRNRAKSGFDAEDFHRNEMTDDLTHPDYRLKAAVEDVYLPETSYITASSELIAARYAKLFSRPVVTILNVFPKIGIARPAKDSQGPLRLFWFSQTIGPGRGLETVISAIMAAGSAMELHLLGNPRPGYDTILKELADTGGGACRLVFHDTVYPDELFRIAAGFDIGFACEETVPLNRDICLTNKLFTYLQCGLAIAASPTTAQVAFLNSYPQVGKVYPDRAELSSILLAYDRNRRLLSETQKAAFQLGQSDLNWENESRRFIGCIGGIL